VYIEKDRLPKSDDKIKAMIRSGVPPPCRPWIWMETSGAKAKKEAVAKNYYAVLVSAADKSSSLKDIEADAKYTFPDHPYLSSPDGQAALIRVLSAYSMHDDKTGYARPMSVIAGLLLVAMNRNEESVFWLLSSLIQDILLPNTYSRKMIGAQIEMKALFELIKEKLPRLHAHMIATETDISLIATDWYLDLYASSLPSETTCAVLDALFNEGPKILFRVALAILKQEEEKLLQLDNSGDIMMHVRSVAKSLHNRVKLLHIAFEGIGSLSMSTIEKLRGAEGGAGASPGEGSEVKKKGGFGGFMSGLSKLADKTTEALAKNLEKVGIETDRK
jgi:hypothetical protein